MVSEHSCFWFDDSDWLVRQLGLGAAAIRYIQLGYAVLPLARGAKKPHRMLGDAGGVYHATRDPNMVMDWWSQDMTANVGIATGQPSRLAVIDLDVKKGNDGPGEFTRFLAAGWCPQADWDLLTSAPRSATPSGGSHIWLRLDGPVPERPGILPGVDVKGDGGLIVAPPSMQLVSPMLRPGERAAEPVPLPYAFGSGCPCSVPDAPSWLIPWLHSAPRNVADFNRSPGGEESPDVLALMGTGAETGERNRTFYRLACSRYRKLGTDPAACRRVEEELRLVWEKTNKQDFTWREVLQAADSARRWVEAAERKDRITMEMSHQWLSNHRPNP